MRSSSRALLALVLGLLLATVKLGASAQQADASINQVAMFEADQQVLQNPRGTLNTLRHLGVGVVRLSVAWETIAPGENSSKEPRNFDPTNPAAYPAANWAPYDAVVRDAAADHIALDFSVTGPAPRWATGPHPPPGKHPQWEPNASQFGKFLTAVGRRYTGTYQPAGSSSPLPAVHLWEIWNEPNFGMDLAPQAIDGSTLSVAPVMYRAIVDASWAGLRSSGHGRDTIVLGNLDARGMSARGRPGMPQGLPGNFSATKPMQFVRTLYCVDSSYHELRGVAAARVGCPTTAAASRNFKAAHPALFSASGFGDHPYAVNFPPTVASPYDPDYIEFAQVPQFESALDRLQRMYGSGTRFPVYINEYGYITNPPNNSANHFPSPATAAVYINWAEYLSWRSPRIASTMQFLLADPNPYRAPEYGGFASGLDSYSGKPKATFAAYRLPVFVPVAASRSRSREVWGCARPSTQFANPQVKIQFQRNSRGAFSTLATVTVTNVRGYFDTHVTLPGSGSLRLAWTYPPPLSGQSDPLASQTVYSRTVRLTVS